MDKKTGKEPAFPLMTQQQFTWGMSKRFYAACAAMQGYIAGVRGSGDGINTVELIRSSYEMADELLKQENQ